MEFKSQIPCIYGSKCYRKNPQHFLKYSHPKELNKNASEKKEQNFCSLAKKPKLEKNNENLKKNEKNHYAVMKQTTLQIHKYKALNFVVSQEHSQDIICKKMSKTENGIKDLLKVDHNDLENDDYKCQINPKRSINEPNATNEKTTMDQSFNDRLKSGDSLSFLAQNKNYEKVSENSGLVLESRKVEDIRDKSLSENNLPLKTAAEIIKYLFLVDMPQCFYSFFDFCKSVNNNEPEKSLQESNLKLVGPFDVLLGKINLSINKELALCHWRYYYDPPEFQTVLATDSGFHIGYWRDDPKEFPVFLASNDVYKNCTFNVEAENLFGAVFHYLENIIKTTDPFNKIKILKTQSNLKEWAQKYKFSLEKSSKNMTARQKKVVTKSFHKLGIVVPVKKKTKVGYRPLLTTDANLKKLCQSIINSVDEAQKETLWEDLQPLITAANIANDECDFGNGLELGINLFCMGSPIFHQSVEHLLSVAYSLLNRNPFGEIIKAHLKTRKSGHNLSVN